MKGSRFTPKQEIELHDNDLIAYGQNAWEFLSRNAVTVLLVLGIAASGYVIVQLLSDRGQSSEATAWEAYLAARGSRSGLKVAEAFRSSHPDHPLALVAEADCRLTELTERRAELKPAEQAAELDRVTELLETAAKRARGNRYISGQVQLTLGAVAEFRASDKLGTAGWADAVKSAQAIYDKILEEESPDATAVIEARRRLEQLKAATTAGALARANLTVGSPLKQLPAPAPKAEPEPEPVPTPTPVPEPTPKPMEMPKPAETPKAEMKKPAEMPKPEMPKAEPKK